MTSDLSASPTEERELTLAEIIAEQAAAPASDTWLGRKRARAVELAERATSIGPLGEAGETAWAASRRLSRVAGTALAALVAYRVFVFLLPFALVLVAGLGVANQTADVDIAEVVELFGLAGYFAASVGSAAEDGGAGQFYVLAIGVPLLLYETYALVRAARAIHAVCWGMRLTPIRRPVHTTLVALLVLIGATTIPGLVRWLTEDLDAAGPKVLLHLALYAALPAAWLLVSLWLPHRAGRWTQLIPGAIVVGTMQVLLHVAVVLLLVPYLENKEEVYGALGTAAGVMFGLYALGWAIAGGAALNAEVARRAATERPTEARVDSAA